MPEELLTERNISEKAQESVSMGVIPPADLGYMAVSPIADALCAKCAFFIAGQTSYCQKVRGAVDPLGWCRSFEPDTGTEDSESVEIMPQGSGDPPVPMPMMQADSPVNRKTMILSESLDLSEATIDTAAHTVKVRLITSGLSKNRRQYSEGVLQKSAALFEGVKSFANHPSKSEGKDRPERSVRDVTGWHTDVVYENGALYATRHFASTQAGKDAWGLVEDIVNRKAPATLIGLSINAIGQGRTEKREDGDVLIVESIEAVHSVDDVTTPAAGGAYLSLIAAAEDDLGYAYLKALTFEEWVEAQPLYTARLKREWQTVRLSDETKRALTEADQKVKTANAQAAADNETLKEAQGNHARVSEENRKLASDLETLRTKLAMMEALEKVNLPAAYKDDLRERLPKTPMGEWAEMIDSELKKSKRAGVTPKVNVQSVTAIEASAPIRSAVPSIAPRPDEDYHQWLERTSR